MIKSLVSTSAVGSASSAPAVAGLTKDPAPATTAVAPAVRTKDRRSVGEDDDMLMEKEAAEPTRARAARMMKILAMVDCFWNA